MLCAARLVAAERRTGGMSRHPDGTDWEVVKVDSGAVDYEQQQALWRCHFTIGPTFRYKSQVMRGSLSRVRGMKVLDLGCGAGYFARMLAGGNQVFALDISWSAAAQTRAACDGKALCAVATADRLPYQDATLDAVVCLDVLEHCPDDVAIVSDVARVLKPRGLFVLVVPADPGLFNHMDLADGHMRRYERADLCRLVGESFDQVQLTDYGYPVMRMYRSMLAARGIHTGECPRPSLAVRGLSWLAFVAMQIDHLFEGSGKGVEWLYVGRKASHAPGQSTCQSAAS